MTENEPTKTFTQIANERWQQICKIWGSSQIGYAVLLVIIGVLIGRFVLFPADEGYNTNIYTEVLSVALTIFVLDRLAERRERESYKRRLLREVRSKTSAVAVAALEALDDEGWWDDLRASLLEKPLTRAQWEKAYLKGKDLSGLVLIEVNLKYAELSSVDLHDANLSLGDLQYTNLYYANLHGTELTTTKLVGAQLQSANLQYAKLQFAYFEGHNQPDPKIVRLPDQSHWTPETDMQRFTDPEHPEFWSPE